MKYPLVFTRKGGNLGSAKGPFIWLREDMVDSVAILQHELVHVRQWFYLSLLGIPAYFFLMQHAPLYAAYAGLSVTLHAVLYTAIPAYRLWSETQAFRAQVKHGWPIADCASALATRYSLNLTTAQALKRLQA